MKQAPITLGGINIMAGERKFIDLLLPPLYTHAQMSMPVYISHGRQPGPKLFVSAAIHGDEINGIEIIRRLIRTKTLKTLKGTLFAIPVVNPFGFINKSRYLPDRRDLNRCFPGHEGGSLAGQLAHTFLTEIVSQCDYGIDLHTAAIGRTNLPQIRTLLSDNDEMKALATAFRAPVVLNAGLREGSLRKAANEYGTKILLYEAGEALRFDEIPIRAGVKGILSVMRHLKMLAPAKRKKPIDPVFSNSSRWVRSPQSGIMRIQKSMGQEVEKGDVLGYVSDSFGTAEEPIYAPSAGIIIGRSTLPLVLEGEALFHIASLSHKDNATDTMESFHHELDPDMSNPFS